jgi:hypothetical protein
MRPVFARKAAIRRQAALQYMTFSQSAASRLRHWMGALHTVHDLHGVFCWLNLVAAKFIA